MEQVPPGGADLYGAPDAPATIAEALKQRMEKYQARKLIILATDIDGEICTRLRRGKPRRMAMDLRRGEWEGSASNIRWVET